MGASNRNRGIKAQTATELAVFGAILLFVIGIIVRQTMGFSHIQNQSLRALRMAMKMSYEHSSGFRASPVQQGLYVGNTSHNFASVLLIEDRLSTDSAKYGALSRNPSIANAQAAHSRNLFMPMDANETYNLPVFDMFINGKHFPFTTGKFKVVCMSQTEGECPGAYDVWLGNLDPNFWEDNDPSSPCVVRRPPNLPLQYYGCARLYTATPNNNSNLSWCDTNPCPCPLASCPPGYRVFPTSQRFDLDRNGSTDVPGGIQDDFAWQWALVSAFDGDKQVSSRVPLDLMVGDLVSQGQEEDSEAKNLVLDVDNDLKEETIIRNSFSHNGAGVILKMTVLDSQEGDMDFSYDTSDYNRYQAFLGGTPPTPPLTAQPEPGLMKDVAMYTRVLPGTFLEIREGRLYNAAQQVVRNIQRKDHVDIIQRMIQLSNDTGRFCTGASVNNDPNIWRDTPNPVEVCDTQCFTSANITRTCFDTDDLIIFVRSRVQDSFGRQWITDTTSDDYINFVVPPVP